MAKKPSGDAVSEYLAEIGRRGGQVSGVPKGFAAADPERRAAIAKKAAEARWGKKKRVKKKGK